MVGAEYEAAREAFARLQAIDGVELSIDLDTEALAKMFDLDEDEVDRRIVEAFGKLDLEFAALEDPNGSGYAIMSRIDPE